MPVPTLAVQSNGVGDVSDDEFNTFVQGGALIANLRAFIGVANSTVILVGAATAGDGGGGVFYWDPTATVADNGVTVIQPNGLTTGRWLSVAYATAATNPGVFTNTQMNDPFSFLVNGLNPTTEFQWSHPGEYATQALTAGIIVPGTSTVYTATAFGAYVQNGSTAAAGAVGGLFYGRNTVAGATIYGINPLVTDQNAGGTGGVASTVVGGEIDVGAFNPLSTAYGFNMVGVFPFGTPLGGVAYQVSVLNDPWRYAFTSANGAALVGINLGAVGTAAGSDGQVINLTAFDNAGTAHLVGIQAVHAASGADLFLNTPTGAVLTSGPMLIGGAATFGTTAVAVGGVGFWNHAPPGSQPTITGSRSGATVAVLTALLTALAATGIIVDGTTT